MLHEAPGVHEVHEVTDLTNLFERLSDPLFWNSIELGDKLSPRFPNAKKLSVTDGRTDRPTM